MSTRTDGVPGRGAARDTAALLGRQLRDLRALLEQMGLPAELVADLAAPAPSGPDALDLPVRFARHLLGAREPTPQALGDAAGAYAHARAFLLWGATQGVYAFDPDALAAIAASDLTDLPVQLLAHLPEWCPFVAARLLPGMLGFFVSAGPDPSGEGDVLELAFVLSPHAPGWTGRPALRSATPGPLGTWLYHVDLPLRPGSIGAAMAGGDAALAASARHRWLRARDPEAYAAMLAERERMLPVTTQAIAATVYLCSREPDLADVTPPSWAPRPARPARPTHGVRAWVVGARIGAALRTWAQTPDPDPAGPGPGGRARPRPHVRRAHFHTYWLGPREGGQRRVEVRWLPPVPVAGTAADVVPTARPVDPPPAGPGEARG